jgi:hypothetical protein
MCVIARVSPRALCNFLVDLKPYQRRKSRLTVEKRVVHGKSAFIDRDQSQNL